jgi:hypothetical protein
MLIERRYILYRNPRSEDRTPDTQRPRKLQWSRRKLAVTNLPDFSLMHCTIIIVAW